MEIRSLQSDEIGMMEALYQNAYRIDTPTVRTWSDRANLDYTRAIVDQGRVLSMIKIVPFQIEVGERAVSMGGISGVATWADQQGKGHASKLMSYSVGEMRRLGHAVSILYPFSHRYYGKFGWELAGRRFVYQNFSQHQLPRSKSAEGIRAALNAEDLALIKQLYQKLCHLYNGMVIRGERLWERHEKWFAEDRHQPYLIHDPASGEAIGYFVCEDRLTPAGDGYETTVREFACLDHSAYRALFGFLATLPTNVRRIRIVAPDWPSLWPYFLEPFIETSVHALHQARVVDVAAACQARGWAAEASASVVFSISDPFGPWNEGAWRLEVSGGKASIEPTQAEAEIALSIQEFSALYLGFADPTSWARAGRVSERSASAAVRLRQLFCDKSTHILDSF